MLKNSYLMVSICFCFISCTDADFNPIESGDVHTGGGSQQPNSEHSAPTSHLSSENADADEKVHVHEVVLENGYLRIEGKGFQNIHSIYLRKENENRPLNLIERSAEKIVATAGNAFRLLASETYELIVSTAHAEEIYPISIEITDGSIPLAKLDISDASEGAVLTFDGQRWKAVQQVSNKSRKFSITDRDGGKLPGEFLQLDGNNVLLLVPSIGIVCYDLMTGENCAPVVLVYTEPDCDGTTYGLGSPAGTEAFVGLVVTSADRKRYFEVSSSTPDRLEVKSWVNDQGHCLNGSYANTNLLVIDEIDPVPDYSGLAPLKFSWE